MSLIPDPAAIRAVAERIGRHADATRARANTMQSALTHDGWHGVAANAFDLVANPIVQALRTSANELDAAAAQLRTHAQNVENVLADLRHLGVDLKHSGHDIVALLRDGADPRTLVEHPEQLVKDGVALAKDGGHLAVDGAKIVGHVTTSTLHGIGSGVDSTLSSLGIG